MQDKKEMEIVVRLREIIALQIPIKTQILWPRAV